MYNNGIYRPIPPGTEDTFDYGPMTISIIPPDINGMPALQNFADELRHMNQGNNLFAVIIVEIDPCPLWIVFFPTTDDRILYSINRAAHTIEWDHHIRSRLFQHARENFPNYDMPSFFHLRYEDWKWPSARQTARIRIMSQRFLSEERINRIP